MNKLLQYITECDEPKDDSVVILEGDVQTSVTESEQAGEVVDKAFDEIQSANKAIDSLYRVAGAIKDGITETTDTATVTALAEIAIEQIYESIGLEFPQTLSMEADFLEGAKTVASKIKDHAVRIMAAIVEAFRKAVDWISDFVKKVSNAAKHLENKAKALNKRLNSLSGKPSNASFMDRGLSKALSKGEDLSKRYKELAELVGDAYKVDSKGDHVILLNSIVEEFANAEAKDITATLKLVARFPEVIDKAYGNIFKHSQEIGKIADIYVKAGTDVYTTDLLPGGYVGIMTVPTSLETLRHLSFVIRRDDDVASEDAGDGTMKTLSISEIKILCGMVEKVCYDIATYHHFESVLKSTSVKLTKALEVLKKTPTDMNPSHREVLGAIAIVAPYIARGIHSRVFGFATSCSNSVLSYCEKSIEQYEV
jgi:hypothetical protein